MSLQVVERKIPEDTAELGQELLEEDNIYRQVGDKLSDLLKDEDFVWMYSSTGGPALSPVILALVLVFQMGAFHLLKTVSFWYSMVTQLKTIPQ